MSSISNNFAPIQPTGSAEELSKKTSSISPKGISDAMVVKAAQILKERNDSAFDIRGVSISPPEEPSTLRRSPRSDDLPSLAKSKMRKFPRSGDLSTLVKDSSLLPRSPPASMDLTTLVKL